jgi:hypothetical protein
VFSVGVKITAIIDAGLPPKFWYQFTTVVGVRSQNIVVWKQIPVCIVTPLCFRWHPKVRCHRYVPSNSRSVVVLKFSIRVNIYASEERDSCSGVLTWTQIDDMTCTLCSRRLAAPPSAGYMQITAKRWCRLLSQGRKVSLSGTDRTGSSIGWSGVRHANVIDCTEIEV